MDTTTGDDGTAGLVPLPRTLRPLGVLEDEAGSKLTAAGVFKNKVKWNRDLGASPPLALWPWVAPRIAPSVRKAPRKSLCTDAPE